MINRGSIIAFLAKRVFLPLNLNLIKFERYQGLQTKACIFSLRLKNFAQPHAFSP
ncbi:MAG: hypothetical protein RL171_1675 [Pseudomonadota bacterium]|jgi:hypothetical protein